MPDQLSGAGVGDKNYLVKKLTIDKSPGPIEGLDVVFLEILVREKMSLYYSVDEADKSHFFVADENGNITELGLRILDQGDGKTFQELPLYKQNLKALFPSCEKLYSDIDGTGYTKRSIVSIFERLYSCKYGSSPRKNVTKDAVSDFGVLAGVSSTKIGYESNPDPGTPQGLLNGLVFKNSTAVTGGIFMNTKFDRTGPLFSIRQELTFRSYNATSEDYNKGNGPPSIIGNVKASYLKYSLALRMMLTHGKLQPFINIGISPAALLSTSNNAHFDYGAGGQQDRDMLGKRKGSIEFGFFGGVGVMYQDVSLEVRAEKSSGIYTPTLRGLVCKDRICDAVVSCIQTKIVFDIQCSVFGTYADIALNTDH